MKNILDFVMKWWAPISTGAMAMVHLYEKDFTLFYLAAILTTQYIIINKM